MEDNTTFEENGKMIVPWDIPGKFKLRLLTIEDYK